MNQITQLPTRPRVLLVAEAANPDWASVPLVGWSYSQAIASVADVHVVTRRWNRNAFLKAGYVEGKNLTIIETGWAHKLLDTVSHILRGGNNKGWTTVVALSTLEYYYFEALIWRQFCQQINDGMFDLVHRITPLSPTIPSFLASKCRKAGTPFVIGPLNGGLPWAKEFDSTRRQEREWLSYVRWLYRFVPGYQATRRDASAILIGSRATWEQMPNRYRSKCIYLPENAIDPARFTLKRQSSGDRPLKVIFIGRLVPYKGADMLLEAAAPLIHQGLLTIEIVGDGPEMPKLKAMIAQEKLESRVTLTGKIPHVQVQERLATADVFAFPSIREFGGAVVLEAMAIGVVPIVVDYGGPGEFVMPSTGYAIPMGSRATIVQQFRERLSQLANHPNELAALSRQAKEHVFSAFTWDAKAQQTLEVYHWVLGQRSTKPDFGMPLSVTVNNQRSLPLSA